MIYKNNACDFFLSFLFLILGKIKILNNKYIIKGINTGQNFVIIIFIIMKKRLNHEQSLEIILNNTTRKLFKDKGFHIFKLMSEWDRIIPDFANLCYPVNITNYDAKYILELSVNDNALLFELQYNKEEIIEVISAYFGIENNIDIKFVLKTIPQIKNNSTRKVKRTSSKSVTVEHEMLMHDISDSSLKATLQSISLLIK
jgi:hypothetical protein